MATIIYLAMTGGEFAAADPLPHQIVWMACQFSPAGTGLSNLPLTLPPGSILSVNDRYPMQGHDSGQISRQLRLAVEALSCTGVLLDFQRQENQETAELVRLLADTLPCPVAVSECYAREADCPVFLSPCPHHIPLSEHIAPWKGRELWLDLAADAQILTLTAKGPQILPLPPGEIPEAGFTEDALHCHYKIETAPDAARFTFWRTPKDLKALAEDAGALGVQTCVGLYQEWKETVSL